MRFHVLGLYHTEMSDSDLACAYTQKAVKFTKMMTARGHEVITYGGAEPCAHATEHVQVVDVPEHDPAILYDCDWANGFNELNINAVREIKARAQAKDFVCLTSGWSNKPVMDELAPLGFMCVETGIGYYGTCSPYRVFESYAWQHTVLAHQGDANGHWYDAVIPNFFDTDDFLPVGTIWPGRHLFWMGRFVERKGPHIAYQIAQASGRVLWMAGQGVLEQEAGKIVGAELTIEGPGFGHLGLLDKRARARQLADAHALIMPTVYIEPFGGVAVEAMMAGTPVISTDWGAFPEFVIPGLTGARFHTLKEAVRAVEAVDYLNRQAIQDYATARFSLSAVGKLYETYFGRLLDLWGDGWSTL